MKTRRVTTERLTQSIIEDGNGPLVLLIHGFPELGLSWSAQVEALAQAGYYAVAPDMRGYGQSDQPASQHDYSMQDLVGDMVELVMALGRDRAVVIGHDWGAAVAWHCALMRPDFFTAVGALSVPFQPRRAKGPPTQIMQAMSDKTGLGDLYINRFQSDDAHRELDEDPATALRKIFWSFDGGTPPKDQSTGFLAPGHSLMDSIPDTATLPEWMGADHFDAYVQAFTQGGFKAPLDWYRCIDLNWSQSAWLQNKRVTVPALFMVGEHDPTRHYAGGHEDSLRNWVPDLRDQIVVEGAGHWLQQERPEEVNASLLRFLRSLELK